MRNNSEILSRADPRSDLPIDSLTTLRATKIVSREFPDLTSNQSQILPELEKLAISLLVNPDKIKSIHDFSLTFGQEVEADYTLTPKPFDDYENVTDQKLIEKLDKEIELFARQEGLRRINFFPESFDNITGWTTELVLSLKDDATEITSAALGVAPEELSFNAVEAYVSKNTDLFSEDILQAMRMFRYVVLRNLTDSVVSSLTQLLKQILLTSGSHSYSNIALELGANINLDNRDSLEIAVKAERLARKIADTALVRFGALFPQLRRNIIPRNDPNRNRLAAVSRTGP